MTQRCIKLFALVLLCLNICTASFAFAAPAGSAPKGYQIIKDFYARRDYHHIWTTDADFSARGRMLPGILYAARTHGLNPEAYSLARMTALLAAHPTNAADLQRAELLWTYALWAYASDLMGAPLDAETLSSVLDGDVQDNLNALAPYSPLYAALKSRLAVLDSELVNSPKKHPSARPPLLDFKRKLFRPGMSSSAVPALRARMSPYMEGAATSQDPANKYDPALVKAVQKFQRAYGISDDGTIGPDTLSILNRSVADERKLVLVNMQRLREPHRRLREDTRIDVSIARFKLDAYRAGKHIFEMPVIVGKPKRQTISFKTEISGVRLNPPWYVPDTIRKEDFLPLLVQDPAKMLAHHSGIKVVHDGKNVDPMQTDWSQLSEAELRRLRFWRPAGQGNPLGYYRVIMQNPYNIYLHDTNNHNLFARSMRAASSGCVRVSDPEKLTRFILNNKPGWTPQKTKEIVESGKTVDVVMDKHIPIYLDYMTAWFNHQRQVVLGVDLYDLDEPRYESLSKHVLTTQGNAATILDRATDILTPPLQQASQGGNTLLAQSTNMD